MLTLHCLRWELNVRWFYWSPQAQNQKPIVARLECIPHVLLIPGVYGDLYDEKQTRVLLPFFMYAMLRETLKMKLSPTQNQYF